MHTLASPVTVTNPSGLTYDGVAYAMLPVPNGTIGSSMPGPRHVLKAVDAAGNEYAVTYHILTDDKIRAYIRGTFPPGDTILYLTMESNGLDTNGFYPFGLQKLLNTELVVPVYEGNEAGDDLVPHTKIRVPFREINAALQTGDAVVTLANQHVMEVSYDKQFEDASVHISIRAVAGEEGFRWTATVGNTHITPWTKKQWKFRNLPYKHLYVGPGYLVTKATEAPLDKNVGPYVPAGRPTEKVVAAFGPHTITEGERRGAMQFYRLDENTVGDAIPDITDTVSTLGADVWVTQFWMAPPLEGGPYTENLRPGSPIPDDNDERLDINKVDVLSQRAQRLIGGKTIGMSGFIGSIHPDHLALPCVGAWSDITRYRGTLWSSFSPVVAAVTGPSVTTDIEARSERYIAAQCDVSLCDMQSTVGQWDYHRHAERGDLYSERYADNPYYGYRDWGGSRWGSGFVTGDRYTFGEGTFYHFLRRRHPDMLRAFMPQVFHTVTSGWLYEYDYARPQGPQNLTTFEWEKGQSRCGATQGSSWGTHAWMGGLSYAWLWFGDVLAHRCMEQHRFMLENFATFDGDQMPTDWAIGTAKDPRDFGADVARYGQHTQDPDTRAGKTGDYGDWGTRKYGWCLRNGVIMYLSGTMTSTVLLRQLDNLLRIETQVWSGSGVIMNRKYGLGTVPQEQPWQLVLKATGIAMALHFLPETKTSDFGPHRAMLHRMVDTIAGCVLYGTPRHGGTVTPARLAPWFNENNGPTHYFKHGVKYATAQAVEAARDAWDEGTLSGEDLATLGAILDADIANAVNSSQTIQGWVSPRLHQLAAVIHDFVETVNTYRAGTLGTPEVVNTETRYLTTARDFPSAEIRSIMESAYVALRGTFKPLTKARIVDGGYTGRVEQWLDGKTPFVEWPQLIQPVQAALSPLENANAHAKLAMENIRKIDAYVTTAMGGVVEEPEATEPEVPDFSVILTDILKRCGYVIESIYGAGVNYATTASDLFAFMATHHGRHDLWPLVDQLTQTWAWHHQINASTIGYAAPNQFASAVNFRRTSAPWAELKFAGVLLGMTSWSQERMRNVASHVVPALPAAMTRHVIADALIQDNDADIYFSHSEATEAAIADPEDPSVTDQQADIDTLDKAIAHTIEAQER